MPPAAPGAAVEFGSLVAADAPRSIAKSIPKPPTRKRPRGECSLSDEDDSVGDEEEEDEEDSDVYDNNDDDDDDDDDDGEEHGSSSQGPAPTPVVQAIHDERWSFDDSPLQWQYQLLWTDNRYFSWTVADANDEYLRKHGLQHVKDA